MIGAVVFDFDGTLTELTLDFSRLKEEILKVADRYVPPETFEKRRESYSPYLIELIYELSGDCRPGDGDKMMEEGFRRLVELECEASLNKDVFPFVREILGWLKKRDIRIAITTRTCREALSLVFRDVAEYVDTVITRTDTRMVKPHPEHIETALARLGIEPAASLMVGDHPTDIVAGRACGAKTVGVLTGMTRREALHQAGADYIAPDIRSLPEIIGSLVRFRSPS